MLLKHLSQHHTRKATKDLIQTSRFRQYGQRLYQGPSRSATSMGEPAVSAFRHRVYEGILLGCVVLLILGGCGCSGEGLDEQGRPISDDTPPVVEPPPEEMPPE